MQHRFCTAVVVAVLCLAGRSKAQTVDLVAPAPEVTADTTSSHVARMSVMDKPSAAISRKDVVAPAPVPATRKNLGEAKAEMIVGGAAFVLGALMDNDAGSVLMLGGAVVGLYGLWNYLK